LRKYTVCFEITLIYARRVAPSVSVSTRSCNSMMV
jgi:hypothetical protein